MKIDRKDILAFIIACFVALPFAFALKWLYFPYPNETFIMSFEMLIALMAVQCFVVLLFSKTRRKE